MSVGLISFGAAPAHNGGLGQIGLWYPSSTTDVWAVDMMKQANGILSVNDTSNTWPSLLNSNGYPTAMPSVGNWIVSQLYVYGSPGDIWVLDWTASGGGTTTVAVTASWTGGTFPQSATSTNRREYTITGTPVGTETATGPVAGAVMKVTCTISALSGTLTSLRLYRKNDESLVNGTGATSIFRSEFLSRVNRFGSLRFMDWAQCNEARTYVWSNLRPDTHACWAGPVRSSSTFYGSTTTSATSNIFTVSTLPSLTNGLQVQFISTRPQRQQVTAVTKGSPTVLTIVGHGFAGGEKVSADAAADGSGGSTSNAWYTAFHAKNTTTGLPPEYTVTRVDADNISLPIDSTAFPNANVTTPGFYIFPCLYITDGIVSKRCYRKGFTNYFNSEFSGLTYPFCFGAVYDSTFDCFVLSGDGEGQYHLQGVPVSAMISLCNYSRSHPWFTFPFMTDDNFWTQLATLVSSTLRAGLIPRYEIGNEIWNIGTSFWQTDYARSLAAKQGLNTAFGTTAYDLIYGKRVKEVSQAIAAVHGSGANWKMILGSQQNTGVTNNRLQGNATINGGSSAGYPGNFADEVATAPYTSANFMGASGNPVNYPGLLDKIDDYNQGGSLRSAAFAWMSDEIETASTPGHKASPQTLDALLVWYANANTAITNSGCTGRRGTGLVQSHYEGGPTQATASNFLNSGWPTTAPTSGRAVTYSDLQNFWMDWLVSDEMGDYMRAHMTRFAAAGCPFPSQYTIAGPQTTSSNQGLIKMNGVGGVASPVGGGYTGLLNWNNGN